MKPSCTLFIYAILTVFGSTSISAQWVKDDCINAMEVCLDGLIHPTSFYTPGKEPTICPDGKDWVPKSDLWIAFKPLQSHLVIEASALGSCPDSKVFRAMIHESCDTGPIECQIDCAAAVQVGTEITFIPGKTYYLRIDGCGESLCPIVIHVTPANAISVPPSLGLPTWPVSGYIQGSNLVPCVGYTRAYTVPQVPDLTAYRWKIESGKAQFENKNVWETIDNNPKLPLTDITKAGSNRNSISIIFSQSIDSVVLSCEAFLGCFSAGKTYKTIKMRVINKSRYEQLCPSAAAFSEPDIIGGPYLPNDSCGVFRKYQFTNTDKFGCTYDLELNVAKLCDTAAFYLNLDTVNVCGQSGITIDNQYLPYLPYSIKTNNYKGKGVEYPNSNPPKCNVVYSFILKELNPKVEVKSTGKLNCKQDTVILEALVSPVAKNVTLKHSWEKLKADSLLGWETIQGANTTKLACTQPGRYRLTTTFLMDNELRDGKFTGTRCAITLSSNEIGVTGEPDLGKPFIYGPKIVVEKSTQTYCVYTPTPKVTWKSSKGLKYKQYYNNGQSCISVAFPKLTNNGWLIASHGNSCGTEKDSIYVFVKPKIASAEEVPINAANDEVETRQGESFPIAILELFPSPAKDDIQIKCNQLFDRVQCTDLLGRSVVLKTSDLGTYSISFLEPGLYQISIYNAHHKIATQKFVKID